MALLGLRVATFASVVLALAAMGNAVAQDQVAPGLSAADVDRNSPPYLTSVEIARDGSGGPDGGDHQPRCG